MAAKELAAKQPGDKVKGGRPILFGGWPGRLHGLPPGRTTGSLFPGLRVV
jgi:hypothetical protein